MYLTGFADEAAAGIDGQIQALQTLGWKYIESRNIDGTNLTVVDDKKFDEVCEKLEAAKIRVNCFGSGIANWAKKFSDSPESSYDEMKKAIPRMHRLGTKLIRIMSFALAKPYLLGDKEAEKEAIKRIKTLVKMAEDGGVICVHENCTGWASQSYEHTLRMMDKIKSKSLKLVFDTGNPVCDKDIRGTEPYPFQDSLEFYKNVREHIAYVHIKDGKIINGNMKFTFPGEGDGHVKEIVKDLKTRGYDGGFSMEPHMEVLAHDPSVQAKEKARMDNFVEYGRRMEKILSDIGWVAEKK